MPVPVERNQTYTYTSPGGVVFIISDVPALVYENEQGVQEVRYKPAASRVVNTYIRETLKTLEKPDVRRVSFEEAQAGVVVDADA